MKSPVKSPSSATSCRRDSCSNQTLPTVSLSTDGGDDQSVLKEAYAEERHRSIRMRMRRAPSSTIMEDDMELPKEIHLHGMNEPGVGSSVHQRLDLAVDEEDEEPNEVSNHLPPRETSKQKEKLQSRDKKHHHKHSSRHRKHSSSTHEKSGSSHANHSRTRSVDKLNGSSNAKRNSGLQDDDRKERGLCRNSSMRAFSLMRRLPSSRICCHDDKEVKHERSGTYGNPNHKKKELHISMHGSKGPLGDTAHVAVPRHKKKELHISMHGSHFSTRPASLVVPKGENKHSHKKSTERNPNTEKGSNQRKPVVSKPKQRPFPLNEKEQVLMRRKCYMLYLRWGEPDRESMKQLVADLPVDEMDIYVQDIDLLPWKCHGTQLSVKAMREK